MSQVKYPAILVLTGASGAGKTTLIEKLNARGNSGLAAMNCDRVEIPKTADVGDRQPEVLRYWINTFAGETSIELAVLDMQIRPHVAQVVLNEAGVDFSQIVLVDCDPAIRNERLVKERKQPDLANPQMDCWAAYLRGQADALNLPIIQTGNVSSDENLEALDAIISGLLVRVRKSPRTISIKQTELMQTPRDGKDDRLLRFPTAVNRDPTIDKWFDAHPNELGAIARRWFDVMRGCGDDVRELLHDGHPTACVGDAAFGYVNVFTSHVNVGFFRGAEIVDPAGLLEGTGKFMRHVKLRHGTSIDSDALTRLIEHAYADIKRREET